MILAFLTLLAAGCGPETLESPSGRIRANLIVSDEGLFHTVASGDQTVIDTSAMGLIVDGAELFRNVELLLTDRRKIDETYSVMGGKAVCANRCNEYIYEIKHRPTDYVYRLEVRLYDDGFAYRFILPGSGRRTVEGEVAQWRLARPARVWFAERNSAWKLLTYAGEWISTDADSLHVISRQGAVQIMPLLYRTDNEYVLLTEAALYNYSGMRLRAEAGRSLRADFTETDGFSVEGDIVTPWRATIIASDLNALANTDMLTNLNPAPDPELFADTSWIVPGRSLWSWWSGIDGRFMTLEGEKEVIDIASRLGFEYTTIDDGWEDRPDKWSFLEELAAYARSRGVGLFVWRHWAKLNDPADDYLQMRGFLDSVVRAGIKGVKVDFMNGEGIRQIDFNTHLLENAARRKLLVNLHGCQKPTGEIRTYPNEITREGVRGIELNRITAHHAEKMRAEGRPVDPRQYRPGDENQNIPASHNAALPFTRGIPGAADYTPVAFTLPGNTTAAHQLAMAVLVASPLLTVAENPFVLTGDERYRPAVDLLHRLPTVWDETVVLPSSEIGRLAVIARRKGKVCYIAGVNTSPVTVPIPAAFLGPEPKRITIIRDAPNAGLSVSEEPFEAGKTIELRLDANAGFVLTAE